jgi:hypothetical protein
LSLNILNQNLDKAGKRNVLGKKNDQEQALAGSKASIACPKVLMHKRPGLSLFDPVVPDCLIDQVPDGIDLAKCTIVLLTGEEEQRYHQE